MAATIAPEAASTQFSGFLPLVCFNNSVGAASRRDWMAGPKIESRRGRRSNNPCQDQISASSAPSAEVVGAAPRCDLERDANPESRRGRRSYKPQNKRADLVVGKGEDGRPARGRQAGERLAGGQAVSEVQRSSIAVQPCLIRTSISPGSIHDAASSASNPAQLAITATISLLVETTLENMGDSCRSIAWKTGDHKAFSNREKQTGAEGVPGAG